MGNKLYDCCGEKLKEAEINRIRLEDSKKLQKFEANVEKSKAHNILKLDPPTEVLETKSQEIFENNQYSSVISINQKLRKNSTIEDENKEEEEKIQKQNIICTNSFLQNSDKKDVLITDVNTIQPKIYHIIKEKILKEFYVNPNDIYNVNLDSFMNQKVKTTYNKYGDVLEDPYLEEHFKTLLKKDSNCKSFAAVFINKNEKKEIYFGNWEINSDLINLEDISQNIENLTSILKFNGFGRFIKDDNSVLEGIFKDGELEGPGRVIISNGDFYKGIYQNGFLNDIGIFLDFAGNLYNGQFQLNRMTGYGEETFVDNSCFKGDYKNDKKNGKGKFTWSDGSYYEGELKDNKLHGKGIYQWASGLRYEGEWFQGAMQGQGMILTKNGQYFEGQFQNNKKEGFGLFWWNDKKYFLGFWQDGVQHGHGKYFKEGKLSIGNWKNGKFEKHLEKEQINFPDFNFHKRVSL